MYLASYTGGKFFGRKEIFNILQEQLRPLKFDDWIEPFVGAGSILFRAMELKVANEYYINDINDDLIRIYLTIRDSFDDFIKEFSLLIDEFYNDISKDNLRTLFNRVKQEYNNGLKTAGRFQFLIGTQYGGKLQYSSSGKFVSTVNYRYVKDTEILRHRVDILYSINSLLRNNAPLKVFNEDYIDFLSQSLDESRKQLVFLDPPYIQSSTVNYKNNSFSEQHYLEFFDAIAFHKHSNCTYVITARFTDFLRQQLLTRFPNAVMFNLRIPKSMVNRYNKINNHKIGDELVIIP